MRVSAMCDSGDQTGPAWSLRESGRDKDSMRPVEKSVWYIRSHLNTAMALNAITKVADRTRVPCHHGARGARLRAAQRVSETIKLMQRSSPRVLDVALSVGHEPHEAFPSARYPR
jgi:hypothetical protein